MENEKTKPTIYLKSMLVMFSDVVMGRKVLSESSSCADCWLWMTRPLISGASPAQPNELSYFLPRFPGIRTIQTMGSCTSLQIPFHSYCSNIAPH